MDILICKINYNNKYNNLPHQHFVGFMSDNAIDLYVITTIKYSKRRFIAQNKKILYIFPEIEQIECGLKRASYIDCSTCYRLEYNNNISLIKLDNRVIKENIKLNILSKIEYAKSKNIHKIQNIDLQDFKNLNPRCIK